MGGLKSFLIIYRYTCAVCVGRCAVGVSSALRSVALNGFLLRRNNKKEGKNAPLTQTLDKKVHSKKIFNLCQKNVKKYLTAH